MTEQTNVILDWSTVVHVNKKKWIAAAVGFAAIDTSRTEMDTNSQICT